MLLLLNPDQEVVRLHVSMQEVARVNELQSLQLRQNKSGQQS
jgi:hypothetical protein